MRRSDAKASRRDTAKSRVVEARARRADELRAPRRCDELRRGNGHAPLCSPRRTRPARESPMLLSSVGGELDSSNGWAPGREMCKRPDRCDAARPEAALRSLRSRLRAPPPPSLRMNTPFMRALVLRRTCDSRRPAVGSSSSESSPPSSCVPRPRASRPRLDVEPDLGRRCRVIVISMDPDRSRPPGNAVLSHTIRMLAPGPSPPCANSAMTIWAARAALLAPPRPRPEAPPPPPRAVKSRDRRRSRRVTAWRLVGASSASLPWSSARDTGGVGLLFARLPAAPWMSSASSSASSSS